MARWLGRLGAMDGHGSPAHRRATMVACLCARTASQWWIDPACERAVSLAERWAWGDESVSAELLQHADADAHADAAAYYAAVAAYYAADSAVAVDAAADTVVAAVAAVAADAYAYAYAAANAAYNAAAYDAAADAYLTASSRYLADLAHMIRAAIPEVPL